MIVATIDANVLVSAIAGLRQDILRSPARVYRAWGEDRFELVLSAHLINETRTTLAKRYFQARVNQAAIENALAVLSSRPRIVDPTPYYQPITDDPNDNLVLATALAGSADYLVTGDAELLALVRCETVSIVTAAKFVQALDL